MNFKLFKKKSPHFYHSHFHVSQPQPSKNIFGSTTKNHYKPRFSYTTRNKLIINNYALAFQNLLFRIAKA